MCIRKVFAVLIETADSSRVEDEAKRVKWLNERGSSSFIAPWDRLVVNYRGNRLEKASDSLLSFSSRAILDISTRGK